MRSHVVCFLILLLIQSSFAETSKKTETLVFSADCQLVSPALTGADAQTLRTFLERPSTRDLFLSAGGKRAHWKVPHLDPKVMHLWEKSSVQYYGADSVPSHHDRDVAAMATETVVHFPGFSVINTVLNGCRTLHQRQQHSHVVHEFCLIGDQKRLQGSKPVVWLVRKLTGQTEDDTDFGPSETRARSRVLLDTDKQIVTLDIQCKIHVEFPKSILKWLPSPKHKVEERGTKSVRKTILRDAQDAVDAVYQAWLEEQQKMASSQTAAGAATTS